MEIEQIIKLANQFGWKLRDHSDPYVLIFDGQLTQINVWHTKMTVGVIKKLNRKTEYFRFCTKRKLKNIFKNTEMQKEFKRTGFNLPPINLGIL